MKFVIAAIIGGIIGYFTNYIAIKMLFRPYEEKYIFGFKLPFTPGLIPKEQDRIARSVGQTVEDYLLSPEAIMDSLEEREFRLMVKEEISRRMMSWEEKDLRLGQVLEDLNLDSELSSQRLASITLKQVQSDYFRLELNSYFERMLNSEKTYENLEKILEEILSNLLDDEEVDGRIRGFLELKIDSFKKKDEELRSFLPDELEDYLCDYLDENQRIIGYKLRELLTSREISSSIKSAIERMVDENVSGLITSFIPVDTISDKIYRIIEDYIKSDQAYLSLNKILKSSLDQILASRSSDLGDFLFDNMDMDKLSHLIASYLREDLDREEFISYILDRIKLLNKEELLLSFDREVDKFLQSASLKKELEKISSKLINGILNIGLTELLEYLQLDQAAIYDIMETIFKRYIEDNLPKILEKLEISSIIESTIKEFDYEFAEKLILDIADKELKAITNLGAFLGAFIGLLSPLLQML